MPVCHKGRESLYLRTVENHRAHLAPDDKIGVSTLRPVLLALAILASFGCAFAVYPPWQRPPEVRQKLQISMTIGIGKTPLKANNNAHNTRINTMYLDKKYSIFGIRSSLKENKKSILDEQKKIKDNKISIIHVDVASSKKINLEKTPFEMTYTIMEVYLNLIRQFLKYDGLTFYLGGDNFMVISKVMKKEDIKNIIDRISKKLNVNLNCGIGIGLNSRKAVECATNALDKIRIPRDKGNDEYIYLCIGG